MKLIGSKWSTGVKEKSLFFIRSTWRMHYILRDTILEKDEHNFKMGRRNINYLHYPNEVTLIAKSAKGKVQFLVVKVKDHSGKNET